jgi:hypothetical protein
MIPRLLGGLAVAALILIGVLALTGTVTVSAARNTTIDCGSAIVPDSRDTVLLGRAEEVNSEATGRPARAIDTVAGYTHACGKAIGIRRLWAWPLAGLGALGLLGILGALIIGARRAT